jgi:triosephosphate isomerase
MNTSREEASALARTLVTMLSGGEFERAKSVQPPEGSPSGGATAIARGVEVVVCPPFPWLIEVASVLKDSSITLGAQNMHTEAGGAYTGEVSPRMLKGLCQYVLVGQYERRILFGDKEAIVRRKVQVAQQNGLRPILCVGEDADQLDEGLGPYVVAEQLEADLDGANLDEQLVIAYEPSWTTMGRVAPPPVSYIADIVKHIRDTLTMLFSSQVAEQTRVIYGGQVNPRNIDEIAAERTVNGVLAGTASTNATNFATLVRAFAQR